MEALIARSGLPAPLPNRTDILQYGAPRPESRVVLLDTGVIDKRRDWRIAARRVLKIVAHATSPEDLYSRVFRRESGRLIAHYDLPAVMFGLLNRWEEDTTHRDVHGRWQFDASLLKHEHLIARPVADWIARAVGIAVRRALDLKEPAPSLWEGKNWAVALTWDIDSAGMYAGRAWAATVKRAHHEQGLSTALACAREGALVNARLRKDPHLDFARIGDRLARLDAHGTFFTQAVRRSQWDNYDLRGSVPLVRGLRQLRLRGHEIGLHGSYATADHFGTPFVKKQRRMVESQIGGRVHAYRAHYLRITSPENEHIAKGDGVSIASSIGFSEVEGFRTGTAFPFRPWDSERLKPHLYYSVPVHVMDVTLRYHRGLRPENAIEATVRVLEETKRVGGLAVLLWHPHNLEPRLWPGWGNTPFNILEWALENGAATGTLSELLKKSLQTPARQ